MIFKGSYKRPFQLILLINFELISMGLSKEAKENRPKKPLNTYMRFMKKRCEELGDAENKKDIVSKEWK